MEWMVLSMLKLARIEAGAIQFEKHPCSLYAIVAQAKESVAYLTEKRGQQIDVQIDEKQMLVCDGDWLTEAIINLLKMHRTIPASRRRSISGRKTIRCTRAFM